MAILSSYNKPDVTVAIELVEDAVTLATPDLVAVMVGPAYQIVADGNAGSYDGTSALFAFPGILADADVVASSVTVKVSKGGNLDTLEDTWYTVSDAGVTLDDDIYVERSLTEAVGDAADATNGEFTITDSEATFISWGVKAGDIFTIGGSGVNAGDYVVDTVVSETEITLATALSATQSNVDYYVTSVDYVGQGLGATVLVSFKALRNDLDGVQTISSSTDAETILGTMDTPENPLGFAAYIALLNGDSEFKVLATAGDTQSAHLAAAEILESDPEVYSVVPLSQLDAVHDVWIAHVAAMSLPEEKKERMTFINRQLSFREVKVSTTGATIVADEDEDMYLVTREGAEFLANGVVNGNRVYLQVVTEQQAVSSLTSYVVRQVIDNDSLIIQSATDISGTVAALTVTSAELTRRQQAEYIRDIASSIESQRVVLTWPPSVTVSPSGTSITVPGYFLNVALAMLVSSLPSQQPFTSMLVAGFDSLQYSNLGYFKDSDLNAMASGGVMILIQQNSAAQPEVRHQLTTDMTSIKTRELTFLKNPDWMAKSLRTTTRPFIGKYNIHSRYLDILKLIVRSSLENWQDDDTAAGPKIISGDLISIEQNATSLDGVDIVIEVEHPFPANNVFITIRV